MIGRSLLHVCHYQTYHHTKRCASCLRQSEAGGKLHCVMVAELVMIDIFQLPKASGQVYFPAAAA